MPVTLPERAPLVAGRESKSEFRLKGWHVLAMLLAFFGVIFTVNGIMMTIALRTMPGLDARNGYDISQTFNRNELARADAQANRAWQSDARLILSRGQLDLRVQFQTREGKPVENLTVTVLLAHPAARRLDRSVTLAALGNGAYTARLGDVDQGGWGLVIEAKDQNGGERLFLSRHRVMLKDEMP